MLSRNAFPAEVDTVLFQTDVPDILLVRDPFDSAYLCSLVEEDVEKHFYLAVQITSQRLADFRTGEIDLRTVLAEPETLPLFTGRFSLEATKPTLFLEAVENIDPDWLPDAGFLLSNIGKVSTEKVVSEAMRRNATVVTVALDPPEASGTVPKINADRLSEWLSGIQSLVRHATRTALGRLSKTRRGQFGPDPFVLQVYGFSPGSFTVHFASQESGDLFGMTPIGAGMQEIDELMDLLRESPDDAYARLSEHKGHVLAAFESLLELVAEQKSPLRYQWAEPAMGIGKGHVVTPVAAKAMVSVLKTTKAIKSEEKIFNARFTSVNTDHQPMTWRALDLNNKKKWHGRVHEAVPDVLVGVNILDTSYVFTCDEKLEKHVTGKILPNLYLKHVKEIT